MNLNILVFSYAITLIYVTQEHLRSRLVLISVGQHVDHQNDEARIASNETTSDFANSNSAVNYSAKPYVRKLFFRLLCIFPDLKQLSLPPMHVNTFFLELIEGSQYSLALR